MKYSKRFISFFNRKSAPYLPEWVIEAWYVQFNNVDFHLGECMKIDKLAKDVTYGISFAKAIKLTSDREEMKVVRCILCQDCHNVSRVLKYLGLMPERYNKAIQTGICIELSR